MVSQTNNDTNRGRGRGRDRRRNDEEINKIGTARMNIKMIDLFTNGKNDLISSILPFETDCWRNIVDTAFIWSNIFEILSAIL